MHQCIKDAGVETDQEHARGLVLLAHCGTVGIVRFHGKSGVMHAIGHDTRHRVVIDSTLVFEVSVSVGSADQTNRRMRAHADPSY